MWEDIKKKGNEFFAEGRYTEAIAEYSKAIRIDPKQAVLYSNRALAELRLKMYNEAREDAEQAVELSSSSSTPSTEQQLKNYRLLSEALLGLDLLAESLSVCQKGLQLDARDPALMLRARNATSMLQQREINTKRFQRDPEILTYKNLPDWSEVTRAIEMTRSLNPSSEDILNIQNARQMKQMHDFLKRNAQAHQWMHGTFGRRVDPKRAFEIFQETANKGSAEGLYNLGLFYSNGYGVS